MMKLIRSEKGNALLLASLSLMALLAITGLVIDGGKIYMTKSHLQKTANAAALSGAQKVLESYNTSYQIVREVLERHDELNSLKNVEFEGFTVEVSLEKDVPLTFSKLFGKETVPIKAVAKAETATMGEARGAVPLGIDRSFQLEYYKEYELKTNAHGNDTGWFGILALGGSGSATYYDNLRFGYDNSIEIGDVIDTETGNVAGKTRSAIKERVTNCPYSFDEGIDKGCSRLLLIPVYEPYRIDGNQIKKVKVTGFAYFYLTDMPTGNETAVRGVFVKRAGPGIVKKSADNRGAYSIRLIE
ncbi:MAG: Tad domain-containing protein [Bacillaceae bacterium]|nr:Tad domain-containing protein [Bacillaceae bacterium]